MDFITDVEPVVMRPFRGSYIPTPNTLVEKGSQLPPDVLARCVQSPVSHTPGIRHYPVWEKPCSYFHLMTHMAHRRQLVSLSLPASWVDSPEYDNLASNGFRVGKALYYVEVFFRPIAKVMELWIAPCGRVGKNIKFESVQARCVLLQIIKHHKAQVEMRHPLASTFSSFSHFVLSYAFYV